jgi:hypothetical protein
MNFDISIKERGILSTILNIGWILIFIFIILYFTVDSVKNYIDSLINLIFIRVSRPISSAQPTQTGEDLEKSRKAIEAQGRLAQNAAVLPYTEINRMISLGIYIPPETLVLEKTTVIDKPATLEDLKIEKIIIYNDINEEILSKGITFTKTETNLPTETLPPGQTQTPPPDKKEVKYYHEITLPTNLEEFNRNKTEEQKIKSIKIKRIEIYPCTNEQAIGCFECSLEKCGINELAYPTKTYLSYEECVQKNCNVIENSTACKCTSNLLATKIKLVGTVNDNQTTSKRDLQIYTINRMENIYNIVVL